VEENEPKPYISEMKKMYLFAKLTLVLLALSLNALPQGTGAALFPIRGFCINAPSSQQVDRFVKFIDDELSPRGVNTLVLLVDYNY
jgi:hypothetical protein